MLQTSCRSSRQRTGRSVNWLAAIAAAWLLGHTALAAAQLPPGLTPPPKPTAMPAFELPTIENAMLRSESLRGQVVVIRFWASW